jgi:hypothetical protein
MSCYYCGRSLTKDGGTRKTKDHVVPMSLGGVNHATNIVACCHDCNSLKGSQPLSYFIKSVQRKINRNRKCLDYTTEQLKRIVKNANSLIVNCLMVYEKRLFIDKYHYEEYMETIPSAIKKAPE